MPLSPGTRLGPYDVTALIGQGGMGEVYRARDTKLGRDVALKVLPDVFADDPERLARFQREARVLASLNHPNIASIYGLEESGDTRALVLELVEGPTLAERIAQGAIPVDEALPIAKQIADALEAAHERGVIHRDLKPANVKVKADGMVKVLDFGLAKALSLEPEGDPSESPTLTAAATQKGVIMGTAAYMSPEQARGKTVDKRADIWAFGVVLFEMLTGRRPFEGRDVSETLGAVLRLEPSWEALAADVPPRLKTLLRRCLEKEPRQRVQAVGDVRLAMEGAFESPLAPPDTGSAGDSTSVRLIISSAVALAVAALVVGVLIGRAWFRSPNAVPAQGLTRLTLNVYPGQHLSGGLGMEEAGFALQRPSRRSFVLSPDGHHLVYVASDGDTTRLYRRPMDQAQATPIPETEGASSPFFAPDGESVGFFVGTQLKRMSIESGEVRTIATSGPEFAPLGASWTTEDTLLVSAEDGILEVPANGGSLSRVTTADQNKGERGHRYPQRLPGGRAVLYNVAAGAIPSEWDIVVELLDTGQPHVVVEGGSDPRYVSSGHIVFVRTGTLMAVPFDVTRLEVTGAPVVVVEDVMHAERGGNGALNVGAGQFSVSHSGSLAYVPGGIYPVPETSLVWVDRTGAAEPLPLPPGHYKWPRFSPDGTHLAYAEGTWGDQHIWVYDIGLEVPVRLTLAGENADPVWSPDGTRLAFVSTTEGGALQLFWMAADGSGEPQRLAESGASQQVSSWSPDGVLAFLQDGDIWTVSVDGGSDPEPFLETPSGELWPAFSPDGRWLAYTSNETGRSEVYVRPFPDGDPVHRVSTSGGVAPLWSSDGQQLFFRASEESGEQRIMVVDVTTDDTFTRGQPRELFDSREFGATAPIRSYDLAPDGQRFVMITSPSQVEQQPVTSISVVLNWFEELKERVPVN